jgi:hypothetical protein
LTTGADIPLVTNGVPKQTWRIGSTVRKMVVVEEIVSTTKNYGSYCTAADK